MEYDFKKSRVTGTWDHKDTVSAKKVKKKCHACVPLRELIGDNERKGSEIAKVTLG